MDPLLKPIKTILPSGLQIITQRTEQQGLMAGEISIGAGAAHATIINPSWMGLPHFEEHMIATGASRKYGPEEVRNILQDKFYTDRNALTNLTETCYFATFGPDGGKAGRIHPVRDFWRAFEIEVDSVFFPKFDEQTMTIQRQRILNEIDENLTQLRLDNVKFSELMFGVEYFGYHALGTPEQARSYSRDDCEALHHMAYNQRNICIIVTGEVDHKQVVEKVEALLKEVPTGKTVLPVLEKPMVQRGEFRRHTDGANEGLVNVSLYFPAVNFSDNRYYPTYIAAIGLSRIITEKIEEKYGFYSSGLGYSLWGTNNPSIELNLVTGQKQIAADALAYALEIMHADETRALIAQRHERLVGNTAHAQEIYQPTVEKRTALLSSYNSTGAALLSPDEIVERFRKTTPDQVATIIDELNTAPAFLEVRGHAGALDAIPSIDVVDGWRSLPKPPKNGGSTPSTSSPPPPRPA